jgi:2-phospho-L-lactate guanylyltransferase
MDASRREVTVPGVAWTVLVPVKELARGKSRLRGARPAVPHHDLALALVLDTLTAALACPVVATAVVISSDETVGAAARDLGAKVVADPGGGLNAALRHGAAAAAGCPLAALAGDLPALRGDDLAATLSAVTWRGYVRDAAGTGTTLLATLPGVPLRPCFGPDSARAHADSGAVELTGAGASLRRDVDTADDLADAARLGLGPRTAALLALA